jgi:hypothetical protein
MRPSCYRWGTSGHLVRHLSGREASWSYGYLGCVVHSVYRPHIALPVAAWLAAVSIAVQLLGVPISKDLFTGYRGRLYQLWMPDLRL